MPLERASSRLIDYSWMIRISVVIRYCAMEDRSSFVAFQANTNVVIRYIVHIPSFFLTISISVLTGSILSSLQLYMISNYFLTVC
ncbi:hypothetical protein RchiOBHm_Chr4g0411081 [Rosa chinensis]|uniref:Uncharacterized protein n=1 Tax=Rosa chinensis TaxID=74649 RepID=A0A2P6QVK5_ROSCH|nr:hypothetical protein RchiOBHm_Chr4g0411081 [Rosa chinensis]